MQHRLISGDNHIDLTYCPPDLWSSQAPAKWKKHAPRVEERNDGQHWFVDDKDRGKKFRYTVSRLLISTAICTCCCPG